MPKTYDSKRKLHHGNVTEPCKFLPTAVDCDAYSACSRCGWNPEVEARRKAALHPEPEPKEEKEVVFLLGSGTYDNMS